jgi:hypothetical protein
VIPLLFEFPKFDGLVVPTPICWAVSIVTAVVPLLVANCNEPELSALVDNPFVVVALIIDAIVMLLLDDGL